MNKSTGSQKSVSAAFSATSASGFGPTSTSVKINDGEIGTYVRQYIRAYVHLVCDVMYFLNHVFCHNRGCS